MRHFCVFIAAIVCLGAVQPAQAGVTVIQALSFGEFVVKRNDAQYDITVNADGSYTYDSGAYIEIVAPQRGVYDIDGMAANTAIASVSVTQTSALSGGSDIFQMVNFQEIHPATTDSSGVARIRIGATARSSGSGITYTDATYTGDIFIEVNF